MREKRTIDCEGEELEIVEHLLHDLGSRGLHYKICEVSQYHNYHKHFFCVPLLLNVSLIFLNSLIPGMIV